jgi:hypothetical protein
MNIFVQRVIADNLAMPVERMVVETTRYLQERTRESMVEALALAKGNKAAAWDVVFQNTTRAIRGSQTILEAIDDATLQALAAEKLKRQGGPSTN